MPSAESCRLSRLQLGRKRGERALQVQRQLLLAELLHQDVLVLDQDDLALADHPDPVGHLLGLLDVMGGQDDGDAVLAQRADHVPHVAPQLHVDARGRLVEEEDLGSCDSALAIITRRFMPPESVMILLSRFSHSERSFRIFSR